MPPEVNPAWIRHVDTILPVTSVTGVAEAATAITIVDTYVPGYTCEIEQFRFVSSSIATGGGATLTYELRKGGPTGAVMAELTIALADVNAVGKFKAANVNAGGVERLRDTDGYSITRKATGTLYTKLEGAFSLILRERPQARR